MAEDNTGTPGSNETGTGEPTGTSPEGTLPAEGTKPAEGNPPDGVTDGPPPDKNSLNAVPESYEEFGLPEGYTIDEARNTEFSTFAKANGWTQEQAQQAVNLYVKMQTDDATKTADGITDRKTAWETELKNDKELGGVDFEKNAAVAQKAIEAFGTPALKEILSTTGLGSHPELVRFAYKAGLTLPEDVQPGGGPGANKPEVDKATLLYGADKDKT